MLYCATRITYTDMHSSVHAAVRVLPNTMNGSEPMNVLYICISTYIRM